MHASCHCEESATKPSPDTANKPLGMLANFGGKLLQHQTFPNKLPLKTPLRDDFDFDKIALASKAEIKDVLFMANRILITLGAGYFHQIYRRAFYYELQQAQVAPRHWQTCRGDHASKASSNDTA